MSGRVGGREGVRCDIRRRREATHMQERKGAPNITTAVGVPPPLPMSPPPLWRRAHVHAVDARDERAAVVCTNAVAVLMAGRVTVSGGGFQREHLSDGAAGLAAKPRTHTCRAAAYLPSFPLSAPSSLIPSPPPRLAHIGRKKIDAIASVTLDASLRCDTELKTAPRGAKRRGAGRERMSGRRRVWPSRTPPQAAARNPLSKKPRGP